jgi:hypothetical protein
LHSLHPGIYRSFSVYLSLISVNQYTFSGPFLYFTLLTLLSLYGNLSLCYALSMQVQNAVVCKVVLSGVVLPLQLLLSGFVMLVQCMPDW